MASELIFDAISGGSTTLIGQNSASTNSLNLPLTNGNLVSTGDTGVITTGMIASAAVTGSELAAGAALSNIGVVPYANGGTGLSATPTNGQLNIGNGSGFTRGTLTGGTGIVVTNGSGTISIAASLLNSTGEQTVSTSQTLNSTHIGADLLATMPGITITLPTQAPAGSAICIKNISTGYISLAYAEGDGPTVLAQNASLTFYSNGNSPTSFWRAFGAPAMASSLGYTGYQALGNGLIMQWGHGASSAGETITFPIAFPNNVFNVVAVGSGNNGSIPSVSSFTTTGFYWGPGNAASAPQWIAIGN